MVKRSVASKNEKISQLKKQLDLYRLELEKIAEIEKDIHSVLWQLMEKKSSGAFNEIEEQLYRFEELSDREILILLAKRKKIVEIMSVKQHVQRKEEFETKITEIKRKLNALKN